MGMKQNTPDTMNPACPQTVDLPQGHVWGTLEGVNRLKAAGAGEGALAAPAREPCGSCPYRRDVPSGVWDASEYAKLPRYDAPTGEQPTGPFACHQKDGRVCSGWAGCHDMEHSLALRFGALLGTLSPETVTAVLAHCPRTPLFDSGAEAAAHGLRDHADPGVAAERVIAKLQRTRSRR